MSVCVCVYVCVCVSEDVQVTFSRVFRVTCQDDSS